MNHITNDLGEEVIEIGMPGSVEWVKCRYPKLIARLTAMSIENYPLAEALAEIANAGVVMTMEIDSLLEAVFYLGEMQEKRWRLK